MEIHLSKVDEYLEVTISVNSGVNTLTRLASIHISTKSNSNSKVIPSCQ